MNEFQLSDRLQTVANYIPLGARLADIGSDHAYLPVALAMEQKISFAVAGEVRKGPLECAHNQVDRLGLGDTIHVRLGDGLAVVRAEDNIDTVTICGMGGQLISDILDRGVIKHYLKGTERLILQPNVGEMALRIWLAQNQYKISAETILSEDKKTYEIIVAVPANQKISYSQTEFLFGPFLMQEKNEVFCLKWQHEITKLENVITSLKKSKINQQHKITQIQQEITKIKEVLYQ